MQLPIICKIAVSRHYWHISRLLKTLSSGKDIAAKNKMGGEMLKTKSEDVCIISLFFKEIAC